MFTLIFCVIFNSLMILVCSGYNHIIMFSMNYSDCDLSVPNF